MWTSESILIHSLLVSIEWIILKCITILRVPNEVNSNVMTKLRALVDVNN